MAVAIVPVVAAVEVVVLFGSAKPISIVGIGHDLNPDHDAAAVGGRLPFVGSSVRTTHEAFAADLHISTGRGIRRSGLRRNGRAN